MTSDPENQLERYLESSVIDRHGQEDGTSQTDNNLYYPENHMLIPIFHAPSQVGELIVCLSESVDCVHFLIE